MLKILIKIQKKIHNGSMAPTIIINKVIIRRIYLSYNDSELATPTQGRND